jgi:hypothetical protein
MYKSQIAIDGNPFDFAWYASDLLDVAQDGIKPIREKRIMLDVRPAHKTWIQAGLALIEDLSVDRVEGLLYLISCHSVPYLSVSVSSLEQVLVRWRIPIERDDIAYRLISKEKPGKKNPGTDGTFSDLSAVWPEAILVTSSAQHSRPLTPFSRLCYCRLMRRGLPKITFVLLFSLLAFTMAAAPTAARSHSISTQIRLDHDGEKWAAKTLRKMSV